MTAPSAAYVDLCVFRFALHIFMGQPLVHPIMMYTPQPLNRNLSNPELTERRVLIKILPGKPCKRVDTLKGVSDALRQGLYDISPCLRRLRILDWMIGMSTPVVLGRETSCCIDVWLQFTSNLVTAAGLDAEDQDRRCTGRHRLPRLLSPPSL